MLDNVLTTVMIAGVQVTPGVRLPPVYHGVPAITATIVKDGRPQGDQTALHRGEEVVWTGKGFQPGETVALSWDGQYRGYLTALPDGTWSVEWYDHAGPASAHNLAPQPGSHLFVAAGDRGDRALHTLAVR